MTQIANKTARNQKAAILPEDVEAPSTRLYSAQAGRTQLGAFESFKEARRALWLEAKKRGLTDALTPRAFLEGALRGAGAWEQRIGKVSFIIKEFVSVEVQA